MKKKIEPTEAEPANDTNDNFEIDVFSTRQGKRAFLQKLSPKHLAEFVEIGNQLVLTYVAVGRLRPEEVPAYRSNLVTDELAAINDELSQLGQ